MKVIDFLKLKYWDYKNPIEKLPFGIDIFCSDVGAGKTISSVELLLNAKKNDINVFSNIDISFQNGKINSFEEILALPKNSIILIDEINLILNSRAWQHTDKRLLYLLTQHRKTGKKIIATAQSFGHIDKQLRDFCTNIIQVKNIANRWFFQKVFARDDFKLIEHKINSNDDIMIEFVQGKILSRYNFIATNELFNSYNTFEIAEFFKNEKKLSTPA